MFRQIGDATLRIREVEYLVDVGEVIEVIRPVLSWAYNAHDVGPEDLAHAQALRRAADLLKKVRLPDPQFICPRHPLAGVDIEKRIQKMGDPDEWGTVFDCDDFTETLYGVCRGCCREVWEETPTSRLLRNHVRDVLEEARSALLGAAHTIEGVIQARARAAEEERDARLIREALAKLGLDPEGGEEALLAWATTAPERHDTLRWMLDPYDGCFGDIRRLRRAAARVAELVVTGGVA